MTLRIFSLGILFAACGNDHVPALPDAPMVQADAASTDPTITATGSPTTLARGGTVTLTVVVTNFMLVDPNPGPPPSPGRGHFHIFYDGDLANYGAGWTPSVGIQTRTADAPGDHYV